MSFSADNKFLVVQTGGPDWIMFFYHWEKGKPLASLASPEGEINLVTVNPFDGNEILATGNKFSSIFRYSDGSLLRQSIDIPPHNFSRHCWISLDKLIIGSQEGILYLVEGGKVTKSEVFGNNDTINCMQSTKYGIAVGGSSGLLQVYDFLSSVDGAFKITQKLSIPDPTVHIIGLTATNGEDTLLIELSTTQVVKISLSTGSDSSLVQAGDSPKMEPYLESHHSGAITGLDLCIRTPLLVTCSSDKSIRIWNYLTGTCELIKHFGEEPQSISLHPSGLYILVGFSDKLRLMNILMDDLRTVREFSIRACKKVFDIR